MTLLSLLAAVLIACTSALTPPATTASGESARSASGATAPAVSGALAARSGQAPFMGTVATVGAQVAASGDFRGAGRSQIAVLQDPVGDSTLRIGVLDPAADGESFTESQWLVSQPNFFALSRAKFAVADVTSDGKDDLIALYDDGATSVRLLVFRSTGTSFVYAGPWWQSDGYAWSRSRNVLPGNFSAGSRQGLLITYQYDNFQMRVHYFESTGSAFLFSGVNGVYDSGPGQYDTGRAKFAIGHFTRPDGPDQIASLYQYPNFQVRMHLFEPSPTGLVPLNGWAGYYDTGEGAYDLSRTSISAADVTGDGKDDLVSLYAYSDGTARMHVFDSGQTFNPAGGFSGWATLPASSVCAGATGLVVGDWNGDRKGDATALVPAVSNKLRSSTMRNLGSSFNVKTTAEETSCSRWPLTGLPVNGGNVNVRPLYVKIDNNPTARPHYGITKADMVYEWLVEGLTTRLAAVFHSTPPDVIGSVRSARMTDTPIVPSMSGALAYSGAAAEELMRINYDDQVAHRYIDLSPRYGWGYRVPFRPAPYNYFTTYQALREALSSAPDGDKPVSVAQWSFLPTASGDPTAGGFSASAAASTITIPYRGGFPVRYDYNAGSRTYARYDDGVREVDGATGEAVAARNIIVIQTEVHFTTEWGLDAAGSPKLDMQLVGSGKGAVFRDGRRQDVTWSRPDIFDVYSFKTPAGEVVQLEPGQTWIHIVPTDWAIPSS